MATMEKSANFSGKNWGGYCQLTYTAGNGSINITGMAFKATNSTSAGYGAYYDNQQTITVTAGGQSRSCTLKNVRIKQTSYVSATFSGASFSGLNGNTTVSFTCRARASSPYNLTFSYAINAGSAVVVPSGLWCSVTGRTETTATISGGYSSNGGGSITSSGFQYRTASGGWQACGSSLSGLQPSTTYYFRYYAGNSAGTSYSDGSANTTTFAYPAITSTPNFTIGNALNITFTNPLSRSCDIYVITNDGVSHFGGTRTGTSISPFNNSGWKDIWYQSIPNNPNGKYKVRLVCSAVGIDTTVNGGTYYPNATESKPIFNSFTWEDINATTLALTGNSGIVIKDKSNIQVTIPVANKATPQYFAGGIKRYEFRCGGKSNNEIPFSSSADVSGAINAVSSNVFEVRAVDTREIPSDYVSLTAQNFIVYTPLSKTNASIHRVGEVSSQTTLEFEGQIDLENFGLVTNSIKSVTYGYKLASDANYTPGETTITPTVDVEGNFTFTGLIKGDEADGFNIENVYSVIVTVEDELSSVSWELTIPSGKPHLAWHKNGLSVMGKYNETAGGKLQIAGVNIFDLIYPVGSIYISTNNTSPATLFGVGTWERMSGGFLYGATGSSASAGNGTGTSTNDHTLTWNEMPSHTHDRGTMEISGSFRTRPMTNGDNIAESVNGAFGHTFDGGGASWWQGLNGTSLSSALPTDLIDFYASRNWTGNTGNAGSNYGHSHNVPYMAVIIWKRTA